MRNRRLFVFIIGLEILLQNMANNDLRKAGQNWDGTIVVSFGSITIFVDWGNSYYFAVIVINAIIEYELQKKIEIWSNYMFTNFQKQSWNVIMLNFK